MRATEFVELWEKLYILVQTPLPMKLRAKDSVPKMYSFYLWLYSFLMVVQFLKNIYMRTTEFVQLWKRHFFISATFSLYKILCTEKTCTFTNRLFQYPKMMPGINETDVQLQR